ncbi:hypothetical protein LPJGGPFB_04134 [Ensifer adhaerens]|uniref:Uncharacterized protein n=1 Tax=Ensifer adhaerens TaxID=106592 RepID=A0ACC5STF6_ENSAD|nr:hypothetical protein [Ensifer adhaerens]NRP20875.1 hypothetical protein [Ensifer adhaerens]
MPGADRPLLGRGDGYGSKGSNRAKVRAGISETDG